MQTASTHSVPSFTWTLSPKWGTVWCRLNILEGVGSVTKMLWLIEAQSQLLSLAQEPGGSEDVLLFSTIRSATCWAPSATQDPPFSHFLAVEKIRCIYIGQTYRMRLLYSGLRVVRMLVAQWLVFLFVSPFWCESFSLHNLSLSIDYHSRAGARRCIINLHPPRWLRRETNNVVRQIIDWHLKSFGNRNVIFHLFLRKYVLEFCIVFPMGGGSFENWFGSVFLFSL